MFAIKRVLPREAGAGARMLRSRLLPVLGFRAPRRAALLPVRHAFDAHGGIRFRDASEAVGVEPHPVDLGDIMRVFSRPLAVLAARACIALYVCGVSHMRVSASAPPTDTRPPHLPIR